MEVGAIPANLASQDAIIAEVDAGLRSVDLLGDVDLGRPEQAISALRLIRDLTSCRVCVQWRLIAAEQPVDLLQSLQPPAWRDPGPGLDEWKHRFRFGLLYWRSGPGFMVIRDARREEINHFTLDEPAYLDAVRKGHAGEDLRDADSEAVATLADEGLVFRCGALGLFIPYRMKRWPIPFNSV